MEAVTTMDPKDRVTTPEEEADHTETLQFALADGDELELDEELGFASGDNC
jgi:hypothetical protein